MKPEESLSLDHRPYDPLPGVDPITIAELKSDTCRWPLSNGRYGTVYGYCGARCGAPLVYCPSHLEMAKRPAPASRKASP